MKTGGRELKIYRAKDKRKTKEKAEKIILKLEQT
jgi:hypothetical protein